MASALGFTNLPGLYGLSLHIAGASPSDQGLKDGFLVGRHALLGHIDGDVGPGEHRSGKMPVQKLSGNGIAAPPQLFCDGVVALVPLPLPGGELFLKGRGFCIHSIPEDMDAPLAVRAGKLNSRHGLKARLQAGLPHGRKALRRIVVGEADGLETGGRGPFGQLPRRQGAVGKHGVKMQVYRGTAH